MHDLPARDRSTLQKLIGRGFAEPPTGDQQVRRIRDFEPAPSGLPKVAIFLPTMTRRILAEDMDSYLAGLAREARLVAEAGRAEVHLFVAMQYVADGEAAGEQALGSVLAALDSGFGAAAGRIGLVGLTLLGPGKVESINAMTILASGRGIEAVLLIDDDVGFSEGCFRGLVDSYLAAERPVAIGARKIGRPFETRSSALLHRLKSFTQPAENYPHACCMIVSIDVIAPEIPPIYSSDDGYICFRLLEPGAANPLCRLGLIEGAFCYHWVGGRDAGEITSRIRRMLLHHHLFLSHAEPAQARYYLGSILFFGLWPWVRFDASKGVGNGAIKCLLKYVYAVWFAKIGLELIVRGMARRPLREIRWGGIGFRKQAEQAG